MCTLMITKRKASLRFRMLTLALVFFVAGCAQSLELENVTLHTDISLPAKRIDLNVAVFIPETSRNLTTAQNLLPKGRTLKSAAYGKRFVRLVADRFQRLFRRVTVVDKLPPPAVHDAVFEASLIEVRYFRSTTAYVAAVGGRLSALNKAGVEIWRSRVTKSEDDVHPGQPGTLGADMGIGIGFAMGNLVDGWVLDLARIDRKQYVVTTGLPQE